MTSKSKKQTQTVIAEMGDLYVRALELKQLDVALQILLHLDDETIKVRHSDKTVKFIRNATTPSVKTVGDGFTS